MSALQTLAKAPSSVPPTFTPVSRGLLQRKCVCGGTPGPTGECEECRKKKLQHRPNNLPSPSSINHPPSSVSEVPPIVHEVLRSPGQPLDGETRAFMEPRFKHDFSSVRVHTDSKAAVGSDVVFGSGIYAPRDQLGAGLLAHERAHVVQQHGRTHSSLSPVIAAADDRLSLSSHGRYDTVVDDLPDRLNPTLPAKIRALMEPRLEHDLSDMSLQRRPENSSASAEPSATLGRAASSDQRGAQRRGTCRYTLDAERHRTIPCPTGSCGVVLLLPIVRVVPNDLSCPRFTGQRLTETIEDEPLLPGEVRCDAPVQTGPGCAIVGPGFTPHCLDEYSICGGINRFPEGTCTRRLFQRYWINGRLMARNRIVFMITNRRAGNIRTCRGIADFIPDPRMTRP
jgi:hypothetical protein